MPQFRVFLSDDENRILNIYKARENLNSKDKAISRIINTLVKTELIEEEQNVDP